MKKISYQTWYRIGNEIFKEFEEEGRLIFHRISKLFNGYNKSICDKLYDSFYLGDFVKRS